MGSSRHRSSSFQRQGPIEGAVYTLELHSPILPEGMVLRVQVSDGQEVVRAYGKLLRIIDAMKDCNGDGGE